jgi:ABC-2 type transport system permease protein
VRSILAIAGCVLRLELKDRSTFIWMLIMPVAFIGLFGQMFRGDSGSHLTSITVVDADQSFLSRSFIDALEGEKVSLKVVSPAALDTVRDRLRTVTIPAGFSDSLANGRRVALKFDTGKGNQDYDFSAEVYVYKAIARMLATLAEMDTASGEHVLAVSDAGVQSRYRDLAARPELVTTEVRTAGRGRAAPTGFGASAQAMLVMFLLMNTTISGAVVLTQEKQGRVLARLATLPIRRDELLAGKVLGLLGLALLEAVLIVGLGRIIYHVYWGPDPLALLLLLICLGLAAAALGVFLGGLLRTPEQAGALGWIVPLFLAAIGGTWWPLEIVPPWMRAAGHISPAAWAMDGMHGLINFGSGTGAVVVPCLVLLGYAIVLTAIGARALRVTD